MSAAVHVVWSDALAGYDFGPGHPLSPLRVELAMALARDLGVLDHPNVTLVDPAPADDATLLLVHTAEYLDAVRHCGAAAEAGASGGADAAHGLGSSDNPAFAGMHEAAAHVVGATVAAARGVWSGAAEHAVSPAGGLHHAMPGRASGFCVYNDVAVAIAWLLAHGAHRVAYVNVNVHHGDGVEEAFRDDPRVLTISLHEDGNALFPGTGFVADASPDGSVVNVPLPPGTGDDAWLRAFDGVVPELLAAFAPDVLVTQQGCDTHAADPLAHLRLSVNGQRETYARLHALAHAHAGGRWVATGGGGYAAVEVVPRAWTHLLAEAVGYPVDPSTPTPSRGASSCWPAPDASRR